MLAYPQKVTVKLMTFGLQLGTIVQTSFVKGLAIWLVNDAVVIPEGNSPDRHVHEYVGSQF